MRSVSSASQPWVRHAAEADGLMDAAAYDDLLKTL